MSKIYGINFNRLITWLVPPVLRITFWLEWFKVLTAPVKVLYTDFKRYREETNYKLAITPQVCCLERAVNDSFDSELRRVTITDTGDRDITFIHPDEAQIPLITHAEGLGKDNEIPLIHSDAGYIGSGYDFFVNLPFQLNKPEEYRLKALLNENKLPGKRYQIIYK